MQACKPGSVPRSSR